MNSETLTEEALDLAEEIYALAERLGGVPEDALTEKIVDLRSARNALYSATH